MNAENLQIENKIDKFKEKFFEKNIKKLSLYEDESIINYIKFKEEIINLLNNIKENEIAEDIKEMKIRFMDFNVPAPAANANNTEYTNQLNKFNYNKNIQNQKYEYLVQFTLGFLTNDSIDYYNLEVKKPKYNTKNQENIIDVLEIIKDLSINNDNEVLTNNKFLYTMEAFEKLELQDNEKIENFTERFHHVTKAFKLIVTCNNHQYFIRKYAESIKKK